jgi:hypothetical protein
MKYAPSLDDGGRDQAGSTNIGKQIIFIDPAQHAQSAETTVLHEMIEILNYQLELNLSHPTIMQLESGLYEALTSNGISLKKLTSELKG